MPVPIIYSSQYPGNIASQDVYKDGALYTHTFGGDNETVATYTVAKQLLSNSVYKTVNAVASFTYYYNTAEAANTFGIYVDGILTRSFTGVLTTEMPFSVWIKMTNTQDHVITIKGISVTVGRTATCKDFALNVTAELSG